VAREPICNGVVYVVTFRSIKGGAEFDPMRLASLRADGKAGHANPCR